MYSHGETKLYYRDMYLRACILLTHIYIYIYIYISIALMVVTAPNCTNLPHVGTRQEY